MFIFSMNYKLFHEENQRVQYQNSSAYAPTFEVQSQDLAKLIEEST